MVVTRRVVHTRTVTHDDGRLHRQISLYRRRTIAKMPKGTIVITDTSGSHTPLLQTSGG